ncbi:MAG: MotA/TolQ/ExbB proton channel family protein [Oscillospiraceae bacterium]|nr:MotA/TolQ/ExbB proton channel family protein [Oscillospiraceae bacterium]
MDLMSLLGYIFGIGFVLLSIMLNADFSITPGNLIQFYDLPSIMIVIGGTIAATMISFPAKSLAKIPKHMKIVLLPKKYNPQSYIEQIVFFAKEARINGLLALEDKLNQVEDKFLKNSLLLVVDSVEPEKVKALLNNELDYMDDRHNQDQAFYLQMAEYAPAFGMIGTLIGLINLLANLSDQAALAASMAVALITTFYGTILANLFFKPIARKLKERHNEEYLCKMIIAEGVQAIQDGDNPNFIQEKLTRLLPVSSLKGELKDSTKK